MRAKLRLFKAVKTEVIFFNIFQRAFYVSAFKHSGNIVVVVSYIVADGFVVKLVFLCVFKLILQVNNILSGKLWNIVNKVDK